MPPGSTSSPKESSKQRSLRIELLYLRRGSLWQWSRFFRSKYVWSFLALVAAAAYVAWLGIGGDQAAAQLSPGPLASPHGALNTKCADCHTAYVSTSASGEGVNWLSKTALGIPAHQRVSDANCSKCHQHQTQDHHSKQLKAEIASCASCHADHAGSTAKLARPDDKFCTVCHENIGVHRSGSESTPPIDNVSFFGRAGEAKPDHPPFRSVPTQDVNNFKFNHQLHLLPGQWPRGGNAKDAWTIDKIAEELRGGYKTVNGDVDKRVKLECWSCHVPQQGDPAAQSGAYMLPIRYEQHCKACHPLDLNLGEPVDEKAKDPNPIVLVPHGLNKREVDEFVLGISALRKSGSPQPRFEETIRIPGKTPVDEQKREVRKLSFEQTQVDNWRIKIKDVLCAKCHLTEATPTPGSSEAKFAELVGFAPPKLPSRWLKHGQFDHRAHRDWATCTECHAHANPPEDLAGELLKNPKQKYDHLAKPSHDDQNVLIPQIEVCARCHAPVNPQSTQKGWARFDCAECHRYHPGVP